MNHISNTTKPNDLGSNATNYMNAAPTGLSAVSAAEKDQLEPTHSTVASIAVGLWADPAPVIALCFFVGRISAATHTHLPRPLAALLREHVRLGDLASLLVADWLISQGVLDPAFTPPRTASSSSSNGGNRNV